MSLQKWTVNVVIFIYFLCSLIAISDALLPGLYCGRESCYDVLKVTRDSSKSEISKAYRKLAAKYHPDRHRTDEAKKEAEEVFRVIAVAYETLKDDESRKNYDYLLDNPDEVYRHYFYYYRHQVAPHVDVRLVIAGTILIISAIQYISARQKYNDALSYLLTQPKYRMKAQEIAKERGLVDDDKKWKRKNKEEAREQEENVLRSIIAENIDIRGGYRRPSIVDTLVIQMFMLPMHLFVYIRWFMRWHWKFTLRREAYGDEEKTYLIRKNLRFSQSQYDCLEEKEKEEHFTEELWMQEKFKAWKAEKEEEEKRKLAESSQYKRYRRAMKNGPGQISFLEESF